MVSNVYFDIILKDTSFSEMTDNLWLYNRLHIYKARPGSAYTASSEGIEELYISV